MTTSLPKRAMIDNLYRVEGQAEPVNGEMARLEPAGEMTGNDGDEVLASHEGYTKHKG